MYQFYEIVLQNIYTKFKCELATSEWYQILRKSFKMINKNYVYKMSGGPCNLVGLTRDPFRCESEQLQSTF